MYQTGRWTQTFMAKLVVIVVILLITLQYLVNVTVFRHNGTFFLRVLDTSLEKIMNQSGLVFQDSIVTTEKPLEPCPIIPPNLRGHVNVNTQVSSWAFIEEENGMLGPGGRHQPAGCKARHRIAVVIPYRDRDIHLKIFLKNIHPFLQRQQLDYGIFVVELVADVKFNRALLMNIGFVEAMKQHNYQCFIFHDVDLLPEDDRNLYTCPQSPRHMSVAIDRLKYRLPYAQIFGGVSAITTEQFKNINGFSNIYFGWGGEDDDMYRRILYSNYTVTRYSPEVARYKMLVHAKENGNSERFMLLKTVKARRLTDGLSSLKYHIVKSELKPLYTWILVSVNETEIVGTEPIHKLAAKQLKLKATQKNVVRGEPAKLAKNSIHGNLIQNQRIVQKNHGQIKNPVHENSDQNKNTIHENPTQNKIIANGKQVNPTHVINTTVIKNTSNPIKHLAKDSPVKTKDKESIAKTNGAFGNKKLKNPSVISWIPSDFKGTIPSNLTKFEPLPIVVPAHVRKIMAIKQPLDNIKPAQRPVVHQTRGKVKKVNAVKGKTRKPVHVIAVNVAKDKNRRQSVNVKPDSSNKIVHGRISQKRVAAGKEVHVSNVSR